MQTGAGRWTDREIAGFIGEIGAIRGVSRALLLDPSGRVLSASGGTDPDELLTLSALAIDACDAGSRLNRALAKDPPTGIKMVSAARGSGESSVALLRLPDTGAAGEPLVLLVVATEEALAALCASMEDFSGRASTQTGDGHNMHEEEGFGDSLLDSLDRLFP